MNTRETLMIYGGVFLAFIMVAILIYTATRGQNIKQGWQWSSRGPSIDIGAYPPRIDDSYWNKATMIIPFSPTRELSATKAQHLLRQWWTFESNVDPSIIEAILSLFPSLQTIPSIESYGLSDGMIKVLNIIESYLLRPDQFKTVDDVYRLIGPKAIQSFYNHLDEKPQSGLYEDAKNMGWGTGTL